MTKAIALVLLIYSQVVFAGASVPKNPTDIFRLRAPSSLESEWGSPISPTTLNLGPLPEATSAAPQTYVHWGIFTAEPHGYLNLGIGARCNRRAGYRTCY